MAIKDDKIPETGFIAIIRHYLNPFEIVRAIQLCRSDLAGLIIFKQAQVICTLWFQFFGAVFASKGYSF